MEGVEFHHVVTGSGRSSGRHHDVTRPAGRARTCRSASSPIQSLLARVMMDSWGVVEVWRNGGGRRRDAGARAGGRLLRQVSVYKRRLRWEQWRLVLGRSVLVDIRWRHGALCHCTACFTAPLYVCNANNKQHHWKRSKISNLCQGRCCHLANTAECQCTP